MPTLATPMVIVEVITKRAHTAVVERNREAVISRYGNVNLTGLTFFGAHETVGHKHETVGTGARDFRRFAVDLRCRQTQMGTVAVDCGAIVSAVRLSVRVVHVHYHRVLSLKQRSVRLFNRFG